MAAFAELPDPGQATTVDGLVERLRLLKVWAGELAGKTTVVDCFRFGRQRLNPELVVAAVAALRPDVGCAAQWRLAGQPQPVSGGECGSCRSTCPSAGSR